MRNPTEVRWQKDTSGIQRLRWGLQKQLEGKHIYSLSQRNQADALSLRFGGQGGKEMSKGDNEKQVFLLLLQPQGVETLLSGLLLEYNKSSVQRTELP